MGGNGKDQTSSHCLSVPPPFPKCGLPLCPPHRRPAFLGGQGERAARGGRSAKTHSGVEVSCPTCPERGGAARVTQHKATQTSSYSGAFGAALLRLGSPLASPACCWERQCLGRSAGR